VLWHPKGARIRKLIEDFWSEEHINNGYDFVYTPHIGKAQLWETSGHLGFYKDNMYAPVDIEGQQYFLKPMNCPFHLHIYKSSLRSYRDLPIRYAEEGTVYRYERSGVLHGLMRVRGFTQDDAHHFCRPDQMPGEIDSCSISVFTSCAVSASATFTLTSAPGLRRQWVNLKCGRLLRWRSRNRWIAQVLIMMWTGVAARSMDRRLILR